VNTPFQLHSDAFREGSESDGNEAENSPPIGRAFIRHEERPAVGEKLYEDGRP
jgi:hypothetical protein